MRTAAIGHSFGRSTVKSASLPGVPNLSLWLDASDAASIAASGGKVSLWHDKSGAAGGPYDVTQSTASAQPSIVAGALNGMTNVAFDGVASFLTSGTKSFTNNIYPASTTFIVASGSSTAGTGGTLWNGGNIAGYPRWGYGIPSGAEAKLFFGGQNDQLLYPTGSNIAAAAIYDGGESVTTQQGFINYNGTPEGSINGNITGDSSANPVSVGARANATQTGSYFKGNVAEVLVYGRLLATAETQQIEGYLACKWGLAANLPPNHPYRNSCGGPPPPPSTVDVDTYHNDALRTGWNKNETILTPANVATSSFGQIMSLPLGGQLDGLTFTQPLVAAAVAGAGNRDLVIAGTNNDSLYAFDANNGTQVWKHSFLVSGATTVGIAFTGCDNTGQQDGLLSTPVVDRVTDTIYVVAATMEPHHIHFRLHALSLATGADKMSNVEIGGARGTTAFNADVQFQRPALLEANGNIYIGFGSQCDHALDKYHGWVFAYDAAKFTQTGSANMTPDVQNGQYAGGIWMSGEGLSSDGSNVYFATGNGTFDGGVRDFGESVLRLPSNLSMGGISSASFFTPQTALSDNAGDRDLGSGGVMLLPDQNAFASKHLAVAQGKDGLLTLLDRDNMGGYRSGGPDRALAELQLGGIWAAPAYWQDSNGTPYVMTTGGPLYAVKVGSNSLAVSSQTNSSFPSDNGNGSIPSVSSNGTNDSSAIVWIVRRVGNYKTDQNILQAFQATNLRIQLFSASLGGWPQNDLNPTLVPTIANGKVYVPTQNSIAVFGLH